LPRESERLKWSLRQFGYTDTAITAAWPDWWSDDAEDSPSAQAELRFSVARKFGLDPRQLLESDEPRFVWTDTTRFKRLTTQSQTERAAIAGYGVSIGRILLSAAAAAQQSLEEVAADTLRSAILASQPFVGLTDLLGVCWALGIPVVHLRIFPLPAKHMSAMCVRVADRSAILLGKDADYPPWSAYYLAHELGHIASGHIGPGTGALVDMGNLLVTKATDEEEIAADRFALQLLTGQPEPQVFTETRSFTAAELARVVLDTGPKVGIEPGTLALCFGYSTGNWAHATAALKWIYDRPEPVWTKVNALAAASLDWAALGDDAASFLRAVMSAAPNDTRGR